MLTILSYRNKIISGFKDEGTPLDAKKILKCSSFLEPDSSIRAKKEVFI